MITLVTLSNLNDAFVLRSMLEANEISAFIPDENTIQMDWAYLNAIGGVRIQIPKEDSEKALSILTEFRSNLKREVNEGNDSPTDFVSSEKVSPETLADHQRPPRQTSLGGVVLVVLPLALIAGLGFLFLRGNERQKAVSEALAAYNDGDYDLAVTDFDRAIQLGGKNAWVYGALGSAYESRGNKTNSTSDYDHAIADFSKALELDPKFDDVYQNRADTYAHKGNYDKAIADYSIAIQLKPTDAQSYTNRGYAHQQKGEHAEAIADYNQALLLNPKDESIYANRGIIYDDLGSYDLAIADYNRALQLDPSDRITYNNRARAYWQKNDLNKALADYNQIVLLDPKDSQVFNNRGNANESLGHYDKALADFNQSIQLDPNYEDAYINLAWFLATCPQATMRDGKRAVELATKAGELSAWKDVEVMDTLAAAYAEAGNFVNALKWESSYLASPDAKADKKDTQKRLALYEKHQPYREGK